MKNRKQSMREVRDAAAAEATKAATKSIASHIADPFQRPSVPGNTGTPRYYRGALVKPRPTE